MQRSSLARGESAGVEAFQLFSEIKLFALLQLLELRIVVVFGFGGRGRGTCGCAGGYAHCKRNGVRNGNTHG